MWRDSFVAFDTETTGLGSSARLVEIAVVTFEKCEPVREWSRLLCPEGVDWEHPDVKKALEVNHIERAQLDGQPTFAQILPDLLLELSSDVFVAHNAEFDMRMLSYELQRQSKTPLKPQLLVCTRDLASRFNWTSSGNRLYEAALRYQVPQDGAHRAAVDARTCGLVLSAMLKRHSLPEDIQRMVEFCVSANNAWKSKRRR